jgi:hypothetical protein
MHVQIHALGAQASIHVHSLLDSQPIEGLTRILAINDGKLVHYTSHGRRFSTRQDFKITAAEAAESIGLSAQSGITIHAIRVWLPPHDQSGRAEQTGSLLPCWKLRLSPPNPLEARNVWVHAVTGDMLKQEEAVRGAFEYKGRAYTDTLPAPSEFNTSPPPNVRLPDIIPTVPTGTSGDADYVTGKYFQTHNCCSKLVCENSAENIPCPLERSRCAQATDSVRCLPKLTPSFAL